MKKIALFFALFAGLFTTAMAQDEPTAPEETTAADTVWVVQGDTAATAFAIADGDYVTFSKPALWHDVLTDAKTYFYYNKYQLTDYSYSTTIQQYGDTNYFYVKDFLHSGTGFTFKVKNTDGTYPETVEDIKSLGYAYLEPVADEGVDVGVESWGTQYTYYTYVDGTASWYWNDTKNDLTNVSFYWYDIVWGSSYSEIYGTSYDDENGGSYGYICLTGTYGYTASGATKSSSSYGGLYIDWR